MNRWKNVRTYSHHGAILFCGLLAGLPGCSAGGNKGAGDGEALEPWGCPVSGDRRLDLLLAIDNSRAMEDKSELLARVIPELIDGLVNPRCVDANGEPAGVQPNSPTDPCPGGTGRQFAPFLDIHIGVISSSIGGHGADSCANTEVFSCNGTANTSNNDKGQLLARVNPCGNQEIPTYANKKFLVWDPGQTASPPGESVVNDGQGKGIVPTLQNMVRGVGEIGCGFESQLESIYRFLVDPTPYASISADTGYAVPAGIDSVLLQQRAEFLRPDSLLSIVMLSDENDCSIKEYAQFYYVGQVSNNGTQVTLPRARQECASDPNDPCCKSCGLLPGNCPDDPTCLDVDGKVALYDAVEDSPNLRCWDQKRRFGIDFLYPTDRYVKAFSSPMIATNMGEVVPNPLFLDLNPMDALTNIRSPSEIIVTGIIGVPWQDIALDAQDAAKGFKSPTAVNWNVVLGDPANYVKPSDPLMIESITPRSGSNPITGDALVDASTPNGNPINGHERTIASQDDLQYACIFPLLTKRDCSSGTETSCECVFEGDNPVCDANNPQWQLRGKAYPSLRQLSVLKDLGNQATVSSVCPAQTSDPKKRDFGYRPAVRTLLDRLMRQGC